MNKFLRWGVSVLTMMSVAVVVLLVTGWGSAIASNVGSVLVANTASNPVPVTPTGTVPVHEQGTANVAEQNLDANGNIKVHEQGTANVNVTNTPSVGLAASGNTVQISPNANTVKIDSAGSGPIQTQAADNPAFSPIEAQAFFRFDSFFTGAGVYTVPAHKELVIEQVSFGMSAGLDVKIVGATIETFVNSQLTQFDVPMSEPQNADGQSDSYGDLTTRIYADPGTQVSCLAERPRSDTSTGQTGSCSISGYLVPVR